MPETSEWTEQELVAACFLLISGMIAGVALIVVGFVAGLVWWLA